MGEEKVTNQNLQTLVTAVGIINTKSENTVVNLMAGWDVDKLSEISDSDLDVVENWITNNSNSKNVPYKVARALVWYIVNPYLEISRFKNTKYPCDQQI